MRMRRRWVLLAMVGIVLVFSFPSMERKEGDASPPPVEEVAPRVPQMPTVFVREVVYVSEG